MPPKPDLIGHRGGEQLGPENTIEVAETALNHGIVGWEVDIAISLDGVPFLMHDSNLKRTTNVEEVFPDRENERADSFTWSELRKLNAGSWYVDSDPWALIATGAISKETAQNYENAKIPSFSEVLNFTRFHDLILDFDTRHPPEGHPYREDFVEILFDMTLNSGMDLNKVMIPTSSDEWLDRIDSHGVAEIWTYRDYINTGDGYTNEEYRKLYEDEVPVMVYTIDSTERFHQLWCLGVRWVKTNAPHKFDGVKKPAWYLRMEIYLLIWSLTSASVVLLAIFKGWKHHEHEEKSGNKNKPER